MDSKLCAVFSVRSIILGSIYKCVTACTKYTEPKSQKPKTTTYVCHGDDMDDELCLAPQLCIRCRSYGHVVVSNADACTCPDDETCPHNKKYTLKKKFVQFDSFSFHRFFFFFNYKIFFAQILYINRCIWIFSQRIV